MHRTWTRNAVAVAVICMILPAAPVLGYDQTYNHVTMTWPSPVNVQDLLFQNGSTLHISQDTLANDGVLEFGGYTGIYGWSTLMLDTPCVFNGAGSIVLNAGYVKGLVLINADGHTVTGHGGTIDAPIENHGLLQVNAPGTMKLQTSDKANSGVIRATGGGTLSIYTTITQSAGGMIVADGTNSKCQVYNNAAILGGLTDTTNGGLITANSSSILLQDITNEGAWLVENGAAVAVSGTTLTNNGTIELGGYVGYAGAPWLRFDANVALAGTGDLHLTGGYVYTGTGATFTNAASHTIHGSGRIYGAMINDGTVTADGVGLSLLDEPKTNNNMIEAVNGTPINLETGITQSPAGTLLAEGEHAVFQLSGNASITGGRTVTTSGGQFVASSTNTTIDGITNEGNWLAGPNAVLNVAPGTITNTGTIELGNTVSPAFFHLAGDAEMAGSGSLLLKPGYVDGESSLTLTNRAGHTIQGRGGINVAMANSGTIRSDGGTLTLDCRDGGISNSGMIDVPASSGLTINSASLFTQAAGTIIVNGTLTVNDAPLSIQGGDLTGSGTITGNVSNGGSIAPGNSIGTLTINGDCIQTSSGRLVVELAGLSAGQFDKLTVSDTADLAGELQVGLVPPFQPKSGDEFVIVTAAAVNEAFATINCPDGFEVVSDAGSITLRFVTPPKAGDINGDGYVNVGDLQALVAAWARPKTHQAATGMPMPISMMMATSMSATCRNWRCTGTHRPAQCDRRQVAAEAR